MFRSAMSTSLILLLGGLFPRLLLRDISASAQTGGSDDRTYLGTGSYAVFPNLLFTPMGVAGVTFRTSEANGLLLYMETGNGSEGQNNSFLAHLEDGKLSVSLRITTITSFLGMMIPSSTKIDRVFGGNLNDNQRHSVTFTASEGEIAVTIDNNSDTFVYSTDPSSAAFSLQSVAYVGGLPNSITPQENLLNIIPNFIGCIEEVRLSNDSSLLLEASEPILEGGLRDGCLEPNCSSNPCNNGGRCIARWPNGVCDCSTSLLTGPTCDDDPSTHQLAQNASSFSCFTVTKQPFLLTTVNTATFRMLQPVPATGSILTALSNSGEVFQFYLEDSVLFFEYFDVTGMLRVEYNRTLPEIGEDAFQIDFNQTSSEFVVEISRVPANDSMELIESETIPVFGLTVVHFDRVCVGGVLLELPYYSGLLERVFYNEFALAEERNFDDFQRTTNSGSNFISITDRSLSPWPVFERNTFGTARRISFEFRASSSSNLLEINNEAASVQYLLGILNGDLIVSLGSAFASCGLDIFVSDNQWHWIVIDIIVGNSSVLPEIHHTVDGTGRCTLSGGQAFREALLAILNTPLQFGSTARNGNGGSDSTFIGCMQNFQFQQENGEIFRPNLEALAIREERFDLNEMTCFACGDGTQGACWFGPCTEPGFACDTVCEPYLQQDCLLPTVMTPDTQTLPSTEATPTTTEATPTSSEATPTDTNEATPTSPSPTEALPNISKQIGIALGVVIGTVIIIAILVTIAIVLCQSVVRKRGYYETNESNGRQASVLHYSASLRQISSETVTTEQNSAALSNGTFSLAHVATSNSNSVIPAEKPDKEFYI